MVIELIIFNNMAEIIQKIIRNSSLRTVIFLPNFYKKRLNQMEKLAQIGQISSGLIHDLTSPITSLNLQIEMLNEKLIKDPKYLKSIKEAVVNVSDYTKLIRNYISGNRTKKMIDFGKTINDAIKLVSYSAIRKNIQIQFIKQSGIKINANPVQIYQIIVSLVSNAIESFREKDDNRKIIIKLEEIETKIILTIKDFGMGIKNIKQIFDPFYTTKQKQGGIGIGLSSVKHIVENELKGQLCVQSQPEEGSTFKIII